MSPRTVACLISCCFAAQAWAGPRDEVVEFFQGSRMLGMGGAQVAVASDETALLGNPAGLGRIRDVYGTILDPEVETNSNYSGIVRRTAINNPMDLEMVRNSLLTSPDQYYYARGSIFPSIVLRNFGIGVYARQSMAAYLDPTSTNLSVRSYDDLALLLGYNLRIWDGRIKIGATGKAISRIEINQTIAANASMDSSLYATEGLGLGLDLGLNLAAPWTYIPTLAVVMRDVGGTKFSNGKNVRLTTANVPEPMLQDIDVGAALFPIHSNYVRSAFSVEVKRLGEMSKAVDRTRYYHLGWEINRRDAIFLRAGINQGRYWTGGLEVASNNLQLQLTSYGENVAVDGQNLEDRRYVLKISFRF